MKVYRLNGSDEEFENEEMALEYLMQTIGFNFDDTLDAEQIQMQTELKSVLIETYFCRVDKKVSKETEFDYYFDKGFHKDILEE